MNLFYIKATEERTLYCINRNYGELQNFVKNESLFHVLAIVQHSYIENGK